MSRYLLKLLILFFGSIFLFSCVSYETQKHLNDIESYIMERPDSALAVLVDFDRSLLTTNRNRAHHALLHAMALDKNFIDVSSDSLACVATEYYSKHGPQKYEARSLYYLGLAYYYQGEYSKAILEFTKAEEVAERADSLYLGMTKGFQANTYCKTHNEIEALKCLQEAYHIYSVLSNEYYKDVTQLRLAQVYSNIDDMEKCKYYLGQIIEDNNVDYKIKTSAIISYAFILATKSNDNYDLVDDLYNKVMSEYDTSFMSYRDYWVWAYSLNELGNSKEAYDIIGQLENIDTSCTADYWMYMIEKSNGNIDKALEYLEQSTIKNNRDVTESLQQSLALTQRDYYESQSILADYMIQNRTLLLICISVSSLFLIMMILFGFRSYIRRIHDEKESYLRHAEEIKRQLEASKNSDYPYLKKKYIEMYRSKYEMIGSLYEQYTLYYGKKNAQQAIYDKVSSIVRSFQDDYNDSEILEEILNDGLDGIMSNIRLEMPHLKEKDFLVFRLLAVGFDVTTISHLMNTSMNTIYIRKSRIKQQIEFESPLHKSQFMEVLT